MATKTFKYGHLWTSGLTAPQASQMIPGEIAVGLNPSATTIWSFDGTDVIDLGSKMGGQGDELTIHSELVNGVKTFFGLARIKDVTAEEQAELPANVYKRYRLVDAQGNNIVTHSGDTFESGTSEYIDVLRDTSIVEIYVGTKFDSVDETTGVIDKKKIGDPITDPDDPSHTKIVEKDFQYLNYVYYAAGLISGSTSGDNKYYMTQIDLTKFLVEQEFASGVTVSNGVVTGVVDDNSEKIISAWTDGDFTTAGAENGEAEVLTVGEDGFKVDNIQRAINARHANVIKMNGYTSGVTEDLFGIASGDTIMQAIKKVENKLYSNGDGVDQPSADLNTNNTGLVFVEGSDDTVILKAGTFDND